MAARAALVLETNNLRGGAVQAVDSLKRLVSALSKRPCHPRHSRNGSSRTTACRPMRARNRRAGRPIDFVEIGASTGYYDAKNDGFDRVDAARCDIVVFGDADCRPADDWLEHLLAPFAREAGDAPAAVAGAPAMRRTCSASR